jgi:hypothetical protein
MVSCRCRKHGFTPHQKQEAAMPTQIGTLIHEEPAVAIIGDAAAAIEAKEKLLGGSLGPATSRGATMFNYGDGSSIVYNAELNVAFLLQGAIAQKWRDIGALAWAIPESDEEDAGDGHGRRTRFSSGHSIYWSEQTGAQAIKGAIAQRWNDLGGPRSYLGYPTGDEGDFIEDGRISTFQNGDIFYWPDTGALDQRSTVLSLAGLRCYGETDNDQLSTADEPYVIVSAISGGVVRTESSPIFQGVDDGESRTCMTELYRGKPGGLQLSVHLMEHDEANPDIYKSKIQEAALALHKAGTVALAFIPVVGWAVAAVAGPLGEAAWPALAGAISDALDMGDDQVGSVDMFASSKELVVAGCLKRTEQIEGIASNLTSPLIRGLGATYRVFMRVDAVRE